MRFATMLLAVASMSACAGTHGLPADPQAPISAVPLLAITPGYRDRWLAQFEHPSQTDGSLGGVVVGFFVTGVCLVQRA
jgi:hypothetical protein